MTKEELDLQLADEAGRYLYDPLAFVRTAFPWGKPGMLERYTGPDDWQAQFLTTLGEESRKRAFDGYNPVLPVRMAAASGRGIGKTTLIAWIVNWILVTRPRSKGTVTADSWQQLRTRTWAAIQTWMKLSLYRDWFVSTTDHLYFRSQKEAWYVTAQSCKEENAESFSGQHAADSTSFYVFDEASGISDKIFGMAEGGLSDGEAMMFLFGNPTRTEGAFHRSVFGSERHRWIHRSIDSRSCALPNKDQLKEWLEAYGEDSDWFRVNVRGEAPRIGATELIGSELVDAGRRYKAEGYETLPKILSCDVARFGSNASVVILRQGRKCSLLARYRDLDLMQLANRIGEFIDEHQPDAIVVDGDGLGAGCCDRLRQLGYSSHLFEFHGGQRASNGAAFYNVRAECWVQMRDWLKAGAELPDDAELATDLVGPRYSYSAKSQITLERKEDMRTRGLASPDAGDALAMSFSVQVANRPKPKPQLIYSFPGEQSQRWMQ